MVYFRLIIASFKYCQEKFKQKSFLGRSVKVLTGHVSALSNQCSLGIKETLAEKYFFKSQYFYLKFTICKQCWNVKINIWWIQNGLVEFSVKEQYVTEGQGRLQLSSFIHQSSTNHHSFINQSSIQRAARNLCESRYDIFCKPYFWPNAPNPILVEGSRQVLGPTCTRVQWL